MKKKYYESSARKMVYADRHIINGKEFYFCPCGRTLKNAILYGPAGKDRFCPKCGSFVSLAKIALEDKKASDPTLENTLLWSFMQNPENGFYEDYELSMTTSHSEKQILEGCISLMHGLVDEFREYLEFLGIDIDNIDKDEQFNTQISYFEIVNRLFLHHTNHSGGTATHMKMHQLGVDNEWGESFSISEDDEEEGDKDE